MEPKVSVVVPIYNAERYLNRCLESIVNQTYQNLEIILVDAGSPDRCPMLCDEWAKRDGRIKVLHKENQGAGEARNSGLDNATGKYLFFVDSDDFIDEKTIELCVDNANFYNSQIVLFGSTDVYKNGSVRRHTASPSRERFSGYEVKNELLPSLFTHTMGYGVSVWGKMFLTSVIEQYSIRFLSERLYYSEDALFVLEYFSRINIASVLSENLYCYYENDSSLSRVYREDRENKNEAFLLKALQIAEKATLPKVVSSHIKALYHGYTIVTLKHVALSDMTRKEKKKSLRSEYERKVLRSTLHKEVFDAEKLTLKFFFLFVKLRLYFICNMFLLVRVNREGGQ